MENIEIDEEKLNAIVGFVPFEMLSSNGKPMLGLSLDYLSFEEACEDYMRQLSGKTVVFNAYTNRRREVVFI